MTGTNQSPSNVPRSRVSASADGTPTRPRSTTRPSTVRCGGAGSDRPHAASAPVSPTAATPAAVSAATRRVLMAPASTETTTSSVGSSVMRSPSTCRFSIPAAFNAASISRPPPCTTTSGSTAAMSRMAATTACSRSALSSSSPPNFRTSGLVTHCNHEHTNTRKRKTRLRPVTIGRCARRCRASR